jgi:peptide/nickel transport system ATP-binding protein
MKENGDILKVTELHTGFFTRRGVVKAVNGVTFSLKKGECLCLVGESGCGKTVTAMSLLRLIESPPGRITGGQVIYGGLDLVRCSADRLRRVRGREIGMVFQDAQSAFNPVFTIGNQITEQIGLQLKMDRHQAYEKALSLLGEMGIPAGKRVMARYPHQLSGA